MAGLFLGIWAAVGVAFWRLGGAFWKPEGSFRRPRGPRASQGQPRVAQSKPKSAKNAKRTEVVTHVGPQEAPLGGCKGTPMSHFSSKTVESLRNEETKDVMFINIQTYFIINH